MAVFSKNKILYSCIFYNLSINSILAVIYLTKLQNLINRPLMNCSMSIFPYFYFSNNILKYKIILLKLNYLQ